MKKMEFQKALVVKLMKAFMKEVYKDDNLPNISFTTKSRTVRITLRIGMNKAHFYIPATGKIEYNLVDAINDGERFYYYDYEPTDEHELVIDKIVSDFTLLVKAFLKVRDLHGFTFMPMRYELDNTATIERYMSINDSDEEE